MNRNRKQIVTLLFVTWLAIAVGIASISAMALQQTQPTYTPNPTYTAWATYEPNPTYTPCITNTPNLPTETAIPPTLTFTPTLYPTYTPYPTQTAYPTYTPYPTQENCWIPSIETNTPAPPTETPVVGENVYYVATSGNDSNPGTIDLPWRTPEKAAISAVAGDTIYFREGTYNGRIVPVNSGNANQWITFKAYSEEDVLISGSYGYARTIHIKNVSFIVIEGFRVTSIGDGPGIGLESTHHVTVRNCISFDNQGPGINTTYGIDYITIEGNIIYGNANTSSWDGSGISMWNAGGPTYDMAPGYHNIIRNNIIYDNRNLTQPVLTDGNGIIMDNNDRGGSDEQRLGKTLIANNVIFHNGGRCIHVLNSSNVDVYNNTCWHNLETESLAEGCNGHITLQRTYDYESSVNIRVFNNAVYGREGTCWNGSRERPVFQTFGTVGYEADYNLWFIGGFGWVGGPSPNDIVADPMFVNPSFDPALADFHLLPESPGIDAGTDVGLPYNGSAPDIGAYEH